MSILKLKFSVIFFRKEKNVQKLSKITRRKGLKNADVARAVEVSNMVLSDWKRGKSTPKAETLQAIAKYLKVTVEYLLDDDSIPEPDFSDEYTEIIELYSKLSDENKAAIIQIMTSLN